MSKFKRILEDDFNFDSAESEFVDRELEYTKSQMYDIKYAELKSRLFIPVSNDVDPGATSVTYQQGDRVGRAKLVSNNGKDLPRVDVLKNEFNRPVRMGSAAYGWTLKEVKSSAYAGTSLDQKKARAARRAQEELLDEVAAIGAPEHGIATGFINNADVPTQSVAGADWATKLASGTPDDVITDIRAARARIIAATQGMEIPNTMLVPEDTLSLLATTPRISGSDMSILQWVLLNFPGLTAVEGWDRLAAAGAGATGRMILYKRDPDVLGQDIAEEFTQLPVQVQGLEFVVPTIVQTAGTAVYYPLAADFSDVI